MTDDGATIRRPRWSVSQAAKRAGVARSTIQRHLAQGKMPGAYLDDDGVWSIGVEDLLAAGFRVDAPAPPDRPQVPASGRSRGPADNATGRGAEDPQQRIAELEAALARQIDASLADALRRAEVAEAVARERASQIGDLRRTIAALEAGASDRVAPAPAPAGVPDPPANRAVRRGLLGRIADAVTGT